MKTSKKGVPSGDFGTTGRDFGISRVTAWFLDRPMLLLLSVWLAYFLFDFLLILISGKKITSWLLTMFNFLGGFLVLWVFFGLFLRQLPFRSRRFWGVAALAVALTGFFWAKFRLLVIVTGILPEAKPFVVQEFSRLFVFFALGGVIWIYWRTHRLSLKKHDLEMEHAHLQIDHGTLQLSSHFVLNTLTHISAKIAKLSPELFGEFSNLTSLLRYSFRPLDIPNYLGEEMRAVRYYLEFQTLRFSRLSIKIHDHLAIHADRLPMPKNCLLTLVENVFFHGRYEDAATPCKFTFLLFRDRMNGGWIFSFSITNPKSTGGMKPASGFGTATAFRVLGHHFGENFQVFVQDDAEEYSLLMTIAYGEHQNRTD